jgi:hypothetical protein
MSPKAGLIGLIPALTAISFLAVAIGVDKWQYKNEQVSKYVEFQGHGGLWKFCNDTTRTYSQSIGMNVVTVKETLISVCYDFTDICKYSSKRIIQNIVFSIFKFSDAIAKYILLEIALGWAPYVLRKIEICTYVKLNTYILQKTMHHTFVT